ncbi:MAG: GIY-YIG nuclease family protein, partial [Bacteroidota bacterium]
MDATFHVYILYSQRADQFYIGNTSLDVETRLRQHNEGEHTRAASKRGIPWEI